MTVEKAVHGPEIRVCRYRQTRYWSVWISDRLLAVTVYKKGALAIRDALLQARTRP